MKQLYFIRHGESQMNRKLRFSGHRDTPLTEKGHEQAKQAGRLAKDKGLSFDIIVSSPLQRAHNTAKHVAEAVDFPHENIVTNDLFKERHYGTMEGARAQSVLAAKYFFDESAIDHVEDVELLEELQTRAETALEYLNSLNHDTVLVVAHGAFGRALYRAVNNLPIDKRDVRFANAEIVRFL